MRAINHAMTGAIIGLAVAEPAVALPAALASHYALDAIPHQGFKQRGPKNLRQKVFIWSLYADGLLCLGLVLMLAVRQPWHWQLAAACAFLAAAPDFMSFGRFWNAIRHKPWRPTIYHKFAGSIQWFERPIGSVVEVAWFVAAVVMIAPFFR